MRDTKETIILSAIECINNNGFNKTSIQDIASNASLGKGTIYIYFKSKEELFDEVYNYAQKLCFEASNYNLDECDGIINKLVKRMENGIYFELNNPKISNIEKVYLTRKFEHSQTFYAQQLLHYNYVNDLMSEGIKNGELKNLEPSLLGEIFFGISGAFLNFFIAHPELKDNQNIWKEAKKCLKNSLENKED